MGSYQLLVFIILNIYMLSVRCSVTDYLKSVGEYFGYTAKEVDNSDYNNRIPYEVSIADEKFISEAAKLTGVALSELDSCQHRVVLKLQTDCHKMNDEQLAKMAVQLLNCQSFVEGRKIYPCTDTMSIKDCTTSMDSDTWTSYHLMSNRARAVCYSIRQAQFRGLAEHTVNRLMNTAQDQLSLLGKIANEQRNLHDLAEDTFLAVEKGNENIMEQQQDIRMAQLHSQLSIEDNIKRLADEKKIIAESHEELASLTRSVQSKLEEAKKEIEKRADETKFNHQELVDDLVALHNRAQIIYQRIEESTELLIKQREVAHKQYEATLKQLSEVNITVHNLVALVDGTKQALEEKMTWLSTALGGTDMAVERLYVVLCHAAFILLAMVGCAFLAAPMSVRFVVATVPPLNLVLALNGNESAVDPVGLVFVVAGLVFVQLLISSVTKLYTNKSTLPSLPWKKSTPTKTTPTSSSSSTSKTTLFSSQQYSSRTTRSGSATPDSEYRFESPPAPPNHPNEENNPPNNFSPDDFNDYGSPTPPLSRNGYYARSRSRTPLHMSGLERGACRATTRAGTPCKMSSAPGRDFCYRHQKGSSILVT